MMNKYVMIPAEQYESYKALIKSNKENVKSPDNKDKTKYEGDSGIIKDNNPVDFLEKIVPAKEYKRSIKKESVKLDKKSRLFHLQVYQRTLIFHIPLMATKEVKEINQTGYVSGNKSSNSEQVDRYIHDLYYNLRSPVSFSGFYKLYNKIKKDGIFKVSPKYLKNG